jgi:dTDP-4-dehydrorhamnose 3,5-epimerase
MELFDFHPTGIKELHEIQPRIIQDERGSFVKTFHHGDFLNRGIDFNPREEFFSISFKGTLRGMHFQIPPADHSKLVYCLMGEVVDVVVDLRKGSSYGRVYATQLDSISRKMLLIPKGCAHGFLTLSDSAMMSYVTDREYDPCLDSGIFWNSIDYQWPEKPSIISSRDSSHIALSELNSPF